MMKAWDHNPATESRGNNASFFQGALDRPILAIISVLLFVGAALFLNVQFATTLPAEAVVHVERVDLDAAADNPASLIRPRPFSIDDERSVLLSDRTITGAVEQAFLSSKAADLSENINTLGLDHAARSAALRIGLNINARTDDDQLTISLQPNKLKTRDQAVEIVDAIAVDYIERRNQERDEQKQQALNWAEKQLENRYTALEALRIGSTSGAATTMLQTVSLSTEEPRLYGFLTDAIETAQSETLETLGGVLQANGADTQGNLIERLERDFNGLSKELEYLRSISPATSTDQDSGPDGLLEAEQALSAFADDWDQLITSGQLERPAATIVQVASSQPAYRTPIPWSVAVPLAAAMGLFVALCLITLISTGDGQRRDQSDPESGVLRDPYWPMKPHQRSATASSQSQE